MPAASCPVLSAVAELVFEILSLLCALVYTAHHYFLSLLFRPPDIHVSDLCLLLLTYMFYYWHTDLCFTTDSFFFLSFFFIHQLPSELAERNATKTGHMLGSECDLKMHVRNPTPYKSGPKNHLVQRFRDLTATLTAYIFGIKHDIHKGQVRCKLQGVSYIASKWYELWSTNDFKLEVSYHPPS